MSHVAVPESQRRNGSHAVADCMNDFKGFRELAASISNAKPHKSL